MPMNKAVQHTTTNDISRLILVFQTSVPAGARYSPNRIKRDEVTAVIVSKRIPGYIDEAKTAIT